MHDLQAIRVGSEVKIGDIIAIVISIRIDSRGVSGYEVVYWNASARIQTWIEPIEITEAKEHRVIGFR